MSNLIEVLMDDERRTNRSCAIAALWAVAVCALICLVGLTGAFGISRWWMCWYAGVIVLPILAVIAYAKRKDYRGAEIKHLMILSASLVPAGISVPTLLGFFLMPLPIVVAGRYFSRRFVWETYALTLVLAFALTIPHALFGVPSWPLCEEAKESLRLFLGGQFSPWRYWRYLVVLCYPSFAACLAFFAIMMSRLCGDHLEAMEQRAKMSARLSDMEKGLAIAATMEFMRDESPAESSSPIPHPLDVSDWSTAQIAKCISRCKARAATDSEFAALVERDPAAAVREVTA